MNKQAVFDKIKVAKQELSEAEASVGKVLRELKGSVRADKAIIGEALEAAFAKVKSANKDLAELEQLLEGALDSKTYEYAGDPFDEPRSHPWLGAVDAPDSRYYDLTAAPTHIRSSLEDFLPWGRFPAVESFYALLERLNHPKSALESNDCAFAGPHPNEDMTIRKALQCFGRVMILFRELERNTEAGLVAWLKNELHVELVELDSEFQWGAVGTTLIPVRYLALPEGEGRGKQLGSQLMISFWAWGDQPAETMQNLGRLMKNLTRALRNVSAKAARSQ